MNLLAIQAYVKGKGSKENERGKGPREKNNGVGGVWGKLKESGHRTGRNTSREGTGNSPGRKSDIKKKEKPNQNWGIWRNCGESKCKVALFLEFVEPPVSGCRLPFMPLPYRYRNYYYTSTEYSIYISPGLKRTTIAPALPLLPRLLYDLG